MRITARNIFTEEFVCIELFNGRIQSIEPCEPVSTAFLCFPGLCDIQINGAFSIDLNSPELSKEDIHNLNQKLLQQGITAWCPTIISAPPDQIRRSLSIIDQACQEDELTNTCLAGIHLEGPYISPEAGACGAHNPAFIHPPDPEEFDSFQAASGGRIKIVTLAPEATGAIEFIQQLKAEHIIPALGHTLAKQEQIEAAVSAGAKLATHLGNGLPVHLNRHHNPFLLMLTNDHLKASVIYDGFHLPQHIRTLFQRVKGIERIIMVSDATRLTGMPPGIYEESIGGTVELSPQGQLSIAGTPYLAGAAKTLFDNVQRTLTDPRITLKDVLQMASHNPRQLLDLQQESLVLMHWTPHKQSLEMVLTALNRRIYFNQLQVQKEEERNVPDSNKNL